MNDVPDFAKSKREGGGATQLPIINVPNRAEVFMQVIYKVLGGQAKTQNLEEGTTIGQLKTTLGYSSHTASVNGSPADDATELNDGDYVNFSQAVKGGC